MIHVASIAAHTATCATIAHRRQEEESKKKTEVLQVVDESEFIQKEEKLNLWKRIVRWFNS